MSAACVIVVFPRAWVEETRVFWISCERPFDSAMSFSHEEWLLKVSETNEETCEVDAI